MADATSHQRKLAESGLDFAEDNPGIPNEEIDAAKEIMQACDQIDAYLDSPDALPAISDRIDWAAKLDYMKSRGLLILKLVQRI